MNEQANAKGAMMTPNDQLTELWELLGKGTHKAWPDAVRKTDSLSYPWVYDAFGDDRADLELHHALAIVRDSVEGWLESKFIHYSKSRRLGMDSYCTGTTTWDSLIDAVRYALGKEKE